jgi:alkylated DNA repair dioxygenase AlkB
MYQASLFESAPLPQGMRFQPALISETAEVELLRAIAALPFAHAQHREWTARRRIMVYEGAESLPSFLLPLRETLAEWCDVAPEDFAQALINEYQPGVPLGWHRDAPGYELVLGVSLAGPARMRLRPAPDAHGRAHCHLELPGRSAYLLSGAARWEWQHAISPVAQLRYSVTFRTRVHPR